MFELNLTSIAVNSVVGAGVGYGTNNLAIRMLFKKYPLIGGEGILADQEGLINSLSGLVEEKLITPETIAEKLKSERFIKAASNLQDHLVHSSLRSQLLKNDLYFVRDIPGFDSTAAYTIRHFRESFSKTLPEIMDFYLKNLDLNLIFPEEKSKYLIENFFQTISSFVSKSSAEFTKKLYSIYQNKKIADFLSPEMIENLTRKFLPENSFAVNAVKELLRNFISDFSSMLETDRIIEETIALIRPKKMVNLLGFKNSDYLISVLSERLAVYLNSPEAELLFSGINQALNSLFSELEKVEIPLINFLSPDFEKKIRLFLRNNALTLTKNVYLWLRENESEIKNTFEEWIEDYFSQKSNYGAIKKVIFEIFQTYFGNVSHKLFENLGSLVQELETSGADFVMDQKIIPFLSSTTIGTAFKIFREKMGVINSDSLIKNELKKYLLTLPEKMKKIKIDYYLPNLNNYTFGDLLDYLNFKPEDWLKQVSRELPLEFIEKWLENPESLRKINDFLLKKSSVIGNLTIGDLVKDFSFIEEELTKILSNTKNNQNLVEMIDNLLKTFLKKGGGFFFLEKNPDLKKQLFSFLNKSFEDFLDNLKKNTAKKEIKDVYDNISSFYGSIYLNEEFSSESYKKILYFLSHKLKQEKLLEGKISDSVKKNLHDLVNRVILTKNIYEQTFQKKLSAEADAFFQKKIIEQKFKDINSFSAMLDQVPKISDQLKKQILAKAENRGKEQLINELDNFMGKELQPINNLGAVLGALSGIGLSLLPFAGSLSLPLSCLVYSATGVGTNWLAIKMLFNLKVPFIGDYQGVIASDKNKKRFAESLGHFIDGKLLTTETLGKVIEENEDVLTEYLKNILNKDNHSLINQINEKYSANFSAYLLPGFFQRLDQQVDQLTENLRQIATNSVQKPIPINYYELAFQRFLANYPNPETFLKNNLLKILKKNQKNLTPIEDLLPLNFRNFLDKKFILFITEKIADMEKALADVGLIDKIALGLDDLLKPYWQKNLDQLISAERKNELTERLAELLGEKFRTDNLTPFFMEKLPIFLTEEKLKSDQKLRDLISGKFLQYLENLPVVLFDYFSGQINDWLGITENQNAIVDSIISSNNDSTMAMVSLEFFRADITDFIDFVVREKLPLFFSKKKSDITRIIENFIEVIADKRISDLGLSIESLNWQKIKELLLIKFQGNYAIESAIKTTSRIFIDKILLSGVKLQTLMKFCSINAPYSLLYKLEPEFQKFQAEALRTFRSKDYKMLAFIFQNAKDYLSAVFYSRTVASFLQEIDVKEEEEFIEKLISPLLNSPDLQKLAKAILAGTKDLLASKKIVDFVPEEMIDEFVSAFIKTLPIKTNNQKQVFNSLLEKPFADFINRLPYLLSFPTKEFIVELLLSAYLETLKEKSPELMKELEIKETVKMQVESMTAGEIKATFDFAKPVFNKLTWYGAIGGGAGVATGFFG